MFKKINRRFIIVFVLIIAIAAGITVFYTNSTGFVRNDSRARAYVTDDPGDFRHEQYDIGPTRYHMVAHACGGVHGMTYTNSLNALESNYAKGFRLFEVDFNFAKDGSIVLIHDWSVTAARLTGNRGKAGSSEEFGRAKVKNGVKLLDLKSLAAWLQKNKDASIVTDCKVENLKMLRRISREYPDLTGRFLPQMGGFNEYPRLKRMGYENIILALYKTNYNDRDVMDFVSRHHVAAVSMTQRRAESGLPMQLKKLGLKVYAHTVNSEAKYRQLLKKGVYGIYTDWLVPSDSAGTPGKTIGRL